MQKPTLTTNSKVHLQDGQVIGNKNIEHYGDAEGKFYHGGKIYHIEFTSADMNNCNIVRSEPLPGVELLPTQGV